MHKIIFEGPELAGKSWIMSQIYNHIEPKYNRSSGLLDGCHWFNCDNGVFGTEFGKDVIDGYLHIFSSLKSSNIIAEKLYITDKLYSQDRGYEKDYSNIEEQLLALGFKMVLITMPNDLKTVKSRLEDRLNIYPHYAKIMKSPQWYLEMQERYIEEVKKSSLPHLIIETSKLPDNKPVVEILDWLKEKNEK